MFNQLTERIELLKRQTQENDFGYIHENWQSMGLIWAKVKPIFPKAKKNGNIEWGEIETTEGIYEIRCRYTAITFQHFKWENKVFKITSEKVNDPRKQWLHFYAMQVKEA